MPDYREHISEARDLLELAAQSPEGRAAIRKWAADVTAALDQQEAEEEAGPDPAAEWRDAQAEAARDLGYDVALSETGGAGIELYPAVPGGDPALMLAGQYDNSGLAADGGTMRQYTEAELYQAAAQEEIDRYALQMQGRRPGPARPQYAGLRLPEPWQLDEADADDIVAATMDLAARAGERATFRLCAEAVDELSLSRTPETSGEQSSRAAALVSLAGRFPGSGSPAGDELELELARQREIDRISREHIGSRRDRIARALGAMPSEAETAEEEVDSIVERHRDMLSHEPRQGRTTMTSDREYNRYGEPADRITGGQPRKGGVMHPEVERLAREHGLYLGPPAGNETYPVPSAAERERQQRRATTRRGLFSIQELHRQALRSAAGSRG
jgi:hypothetical protein